MNILLVEDEIDLHNGIKDGLIFLNYNVTSAYNGNDAIDLYYENKFDLIILDLNLPGIDGLDILKEIRSEDELINIIILSARSNVFDKVYGLENGANDYLSKPFDFSELVARIKSLSRRVFIQSSNLLNIDKVTINLDTQIVFIDNNVVNLTNTEFRILRHLMLNKGQIITTDALINTFLSNDSNDPLNSLKVHIHRLRTLLDKDFIKNKRGVGYYVE